VTNDNHYQGPERRSGDRNQSALIAEVIKAVQDAQPALNEEELRWVRLAIQAEAQRIRVRQAIIEKTLTGLVWMALIALGYVLLDYFQARGLNLRPNK
jgi:hypothetical protein